MVRNARVDPVHLEQGWTTGKRGRRRGINKRLYYAIWERRAHASGAPHLAIIALSELVQHFPKSSGAVVHDEAKGPIRSNVRGKVFKGQIRQ